MLRRYLPLLMLYLLSTSFFLSANPRTTAFASRKAEAVQQKRVEKQLWAQPEHSSLQNKTFTIQEWDKHYSPLGMKRAPLTISENKEKQLFEAKIVDKKEVSLELSRWNERMSDLHRQAGISMDDQAQIAADRQLYGMMLQDTQAYAELGEELSLRDLNRFQFRRNRPAGEVPVEQAGSGE